MTAERGRAFVNATVEIREPGAEVNDLLRLSLDVGEAILKSGGDVHRVESTIARICYAYGASHVEVFAIPSLITASVRMGDNSYSQQTRRIYDTSNQLDLMERMNAISRRLCAETPPLSEVDAMIREAKRKAKKPFWLSLLGGVLGAGAFAVFFGGSIRDGIASAFIGVLLTLLSTIRSRHFNQAARTVLNSFVSGVFAYLLVWAHVGENVDVIMMGDIMLLIPGLAFGTAFRDLLSGDMIAGVLKFIQTCLIAVFIALGFFLAICLMEGGAVL